MPTAVSVVIPILAFLLSVAPARGQEQEPPGIAAAIIADAKKRFETARMESSKLLGAAKNDVEREAIIARIPRHVDLCAGFWTIATEHPEDPGSAEGLAWIVRYAANPKERLRAVDLLLGGFVTSKFLGSASAAFSYLPPTKRLERILRTILARNPHRDVRGTATLQLSWVIAGIDRENPALAREEIRLLEVVRKDFADVKHWRRGTLGDAATRKLFEIRHLSIGKAAPEIEGKDMDGMAFRLSDYRGRVVLLDFWGHW